jgi:uroporphyrinogen decarboxylase
LFAPADAIATEARRVLNAFGKPHIDKNTTGPTQIFNLGHGISQYTPPESVGVLVEAVHSYSRALRKP